MEYVKCACVWLGAVWVERGERIEIVLCQSYGNRGVLVAVVWVGSV